jgi:hypothetical protein
MEPFERRFVLGAAGVPKIHRKLRIAALALGVPRDYLATVNRILYTSETFPDVVALE